jgi:hypothetical protein
LLVANVKSISFLQNDRFHFETSDINVVFLFLDQLEWLAGLLHYSISGEPPKTNHHLLLLVKRKMWVQGAELKQPLKPPFLCNPLNSNRTRFFTNHYQVM